MSLKWRWDQGRLDYFQLEEVQRIARALTMCGGLPLPRGSESDTLREALSRYSERPFLPAHYKVWRNYKRVFGCQLLATELEGRIACTNVCTKLAVGEISFDEYLLHLARTFYYPSPVFDDYDTTTPQTFPICAILKVMLARYLRDGVHAVSLEDLVSCVKSNHLNGTEKLEVYFELRAEGAIDWSAEEQRQVREMARFFSQLSFLKWDNPRLLLDVESKDEALSIASLLSPSIAPRHRNPAVELLDIGQRPIMDFKHGDVWTTGLDLLDREFSEGGSARVMHLQVERSSRLRDLYFSYAKYPSVCDMCEIDTLDHYPWAMRLVEIHHLLPFASPLRVKIDHTSLEEIVGLCPSCHRAIHKYYAQWLKEKDLPDFRGPSEAKSVYNLAKRQFHA